MWYPSSGQCRREWTIVLPPTRVDRLCVWRQSDGIKNGESIEGSREYGGGQVAAGRGHSALWRSRDRAVKTAVRRNGVATGATRVELVLLLRFSWLTSALITCVWSQRNAGECPRHWANYRKTALGRGSRSDQPRYHAHTCWTPPLPPASAVSRRTLRRASSQQMTSQWKPTTMAINQHPREDAAVDTHIAHTSVYWFFHFYRFEP